MSSPEIRNYSRWVRKENQPPKKRDIKRLFKALKKFSEHQKRLSEDFPGFYFVDEEENRSVLIDFPMEKMWSNIVTWPIDDQGNLRGYTVSFQVSKEPPDIVKRVASGAFFERIKELSGLTASKIESLNEAFKLEKETGFNQVNRNEILGLIRAVNNFNKGKYKVRVG